MSQLCILTDEARLGHFLRAELETPRLSVTVSSVPLVSDLCLWDMDSISFEVVSHAHAPVIGITRTPENQTDTAAHICVCILERPFSVKELHNLLAPYFRSEEPQPPTSPPLSLTEEATPHFWVGDHPLSLTESERLLLLQLYRYPNRLFTAKELAEQIGTPHENSVSVHMCNLRKKLNTAGVVNKPLTVHNKGYIWKRKSQDTSVNTSITKKE